MFNQSIVMQKEICHDYDVKIYLCQKHVCHNLFKNEKSDWIYVQSINCGAKEISHFKINNKDNMAMLSFCCCVYTLDHFGTQNETYLLDT